MKTFKQLQDSIAESTNVILLGTFNGSDGKPRNLYYDSNKPDSISMVGGPRGSVVISLRSKPSKTIETGLLMALKKEGKDSKTYFQFGVYLFPITAWDVVQSALLKVQEIKAESNKRYVIVRVYVQYPKEDHDVVMDARYPTQQEAERYQNNVLFGVEGGNVIEISSLSLSEIDSVFKRKSIHFLPGNTNLVWILNQSEEKKILDIDNAYKNARREQKEKNIKAEQEQLKKVLDLAISTGKDQVLSSEMVDCDGSARDCSFDQLVTMIKPTGKTYTKRQHMH